MGGRLLVQDPCSFLRREFNWRSLPWQPSSHMILPYGATSCYCTLIKTRRVCIWQFSEAIQLLQQHQRQQLQKKRFHRSSSLGRFLLFVLPLLSKRRLAEPFTPAPNLGRVISSHNALHPHQSTALHTVHCTVWSAHCALGTCNCTIGTGHSAPGKHYTARTTVLIHHCAYSVNHVFSCTMCIHSSFSAIPKMRSSLWK